MIGVGIYEDDLLAVHKTDQARSGDIVVARVDDEVTVKRLETSEASTKSPSLPRIRILILSWLTCVTGPSRLRASVLVSYGGRSETFRLSAKQSAVSVKYAKRRSWGSYLPFRVPFEGALDGFSIAQTPSR